MPSSGGCTFATPPSRPREEVACLRQLLAPPFGLAPSCSARTQVAPEARHWHPFRRRPLGRRRRRPSLGEREAHWSLVRRSHKRPLRSGSPPDSCPRTEPPPSPGASGTSGSGTKPPPAWVASFAARRRVTSKLLRPRARAFSRTSQLISDSLSAGLGRRTSPTSSAPSPSTQPPPPPTSACSPPRRVLS